MAHAFLAPFSFLNLTFKLVTMTDLAAPTFDQLRTLLKNYGALQSAAELHGFLAGQLAAGKRFSRSEWLRAANEEADLSQNPDQLAGDSLYELYRATLGALQSGELVFHPLLPDDDEALAERVDGLGQWCQGFLTGFGLAGTQLKIDAELAEALRDFAAIAQVGADDEDDGQDNSESDLFSICEYVRLTAVEIFCKYNEASPPPVATPSASANNPADLFKRKKLH
jgi:yecA family protein